MVFIKFLFYNTDLQAIIQVTPDLFVQPDSRASMMARWAFSDPAPIFGP